VLKAGYSLGLGIGWTGAILRGRSHSDTLHALAPGETTMQTFDLIIRNGTVATAVDSALCDVGIRDGKIAALGQVPGSAGREIDATGKLVLPGGIDSHCHIEQPRADGSTNADTFESATTSAAFGGTTCVICFSPQFKGHGIAERAEDYHTRAKKAVIDYSFHIIITDPSGTVIERELPPLVAAGHRSIKFFMTYEPSFLTDGEVLTVLAAARKNQAFVVIHAENHEAIKWMTARLEAAGLTDAKYHAWAKPALVEREAIQRVIALAELVDVPIQNLPCQFGGGCRGNSPCAGLGTESLW